jgi:hypothetical protein
MAAAFDRANYQITEVRLVLDAPPSEASDLRKFVSPRSGDLGFL